MDERRDDWRHGVDENLAAINEGRRSTDKAIDDIEDTVDELENVLLRGDPDGDVDGLVARFHTLENKYNEEKAKSEKLRSDFEKLRCKVEVGYVDGHRSLEQQITDLQEDKETKRRREDNIWKFAGLVIVRVLVLAGLVFMGWEKAVEVYKRMTAPSKPDRVHQMIERAKRPRGRPVVRYRVVPRQPEPEPEEEEEKPE